MSSTRLDDEAAPPSLTMPLRPGDRIDRYRIDSLVARSGMASIFRATDLKPENIMVTDEDHTKLIDFGIAGRAGARPLTFGAMSQLMGTPDYISPEQVNGKAGEERSDIYAVGVMLYEMLTGKTPFRAVPIRSPS